MFSRPKINPPNVFGRIGDITKYYSTPTAKCTGRYTGQHSLARRQEVFYTQVLLCNLTAGEVLKALVLMIEPYSIAGDFFFCKINGKEQLKRHLTFCANSIAILQEWKQQYGDGRT